MVSRQPNPGGVVGCDISGGGDCEGRVVQRLHPGFEGPGTAVMYFKAGRFRRLYCVVIDKHIHLSLEFSRYA